MDSVIFDFNGTLYRDTALHEQAWQKFIQELFGYALSDEEFSKIHGRSNHLTMERLLERSLTKKEGEDLSNRKEAIYREIVIEKKHNELIPGTVDFFNLLKENGTPINIATASTKVNVDFYFEFFQLNRWFDLDKVVYDNGKLPSKPAPDQYIQAALNINTVPKKMTIFEDSPIGLQGAANAKAKRIIAMSTNNNHAELEQTGVVDFIIDDFTDERLRELFN